MATLMHDTMPNQPNIADLFQLASGQHGYFTATQAHQSGVSNDLVKHHVRSGKFLPAYRGVYRFRDYPSTVREEVTAAWLAIGKDDAVVSHESALDLLDLTDIIPYGIHLTVPRKRRYARRIPGIILHTTGRVFTSADLQTVNGVKVTSVTRTIVDVAEAGQSPEHVQAAVAQALDRGLISAQRLRATAATMSRRVQRMIELALEGAAQ